MMGHLAGLEKLSFVWQDIRVLQEIKYWTLAMVTSISNMSSMGRDQMKASSSGELKWNLIRNMTNLIQAFFLTSNKEFIQKDAEGIIRSFTSMKDILREK